MKNKFTLKLLAAAAFFAMPPHPAQAEPTIEFIGEFVSRQSGSPSIAIHGDYAYVLFTDTYDAYKGKIRRYDLTTGASVVSGRLFDTIGQEDRSHNDSAIAVDGDGYLHVMIGMHNHHMKYYKSTAPGAYNSFTNLSTSMPGYYDTGIDQKRYTYPSARTASNGDVVFVLRRTGINGNLRESWYFEKQDLYHYDVSEGEWNLIWIKGKATDGGANYRDAYMSRIYADDDNNVHVVTAWAKRHVDNNTFQRATYLKFDLDTGTFHKADGTDVTANLPIYVDDTDGSVDFCFNSGVPWGDNTTEIQTPNIAINDLGYPVVSFARNWEPNLSKGGTIRETGQRVPEPEDELSISTWNGTEWVLTDRIVELRSKTRVPITNTGGMINTYSRDRRSVRHIISSMNHGITWPEVYSDGTTSWISHVIEQDALTDLMLAGTALYRVSYTPEKLMPGYFDIHTGSTAGSEVTGRIHLLSNKDAHQAPVPDSYTFTLTSNPGGYFTVEAQRSAKGRLFGVLKVAPGKTLASTPTDYPLSVEMRDGDSIVGLLDLTVHAVAETVHEKAMDYLHDFPIAEDRLYGRRNYSSSEIDQLLAELEDNGGQFSGFTFYTKDVLSYPVGSGTLQAEWMEVAKRIGGLGRAYYDSPVYGPGGNAAQRTRLKAGLYDALEELLDAVPIEGEDVRVDGSPISPDLGDGFMRLSDIGVISFNFASHAWELTDPLTGPALWLMPELYAEARAGDPQALALHEKLVGIFQLTFANPPAYREVNDPGARWDQLTDTDHTEGVFSDANLGHRSRGWLSMLGIWADYNRPITYVPYYYDGYFDTEAYPGFLYMPGWAPRGILKDLEFWITHFHRPAHVFAQSGFHPDGTVSHHDDFASDIAMYAYGYGWLTDVISGYELLKDLPVDLGSAGYQFIADRYLYSYDRIAYKNYFDYTVTGREYVEPDGTKLMDRMPAMIDRLLAARQPETLIANEAELTAWSDRIEERTHEYSGNIPFWIGNYLVHRRGGGGETPYYMSVKMKNDRTNGAEDFESVKKSWHAGSGILQAMVRGDEYDQARWNMDWHALPGLTEEWRTDAIQYDGDYLPGGSAYSGMASDGRYGFAAMQYRSLGPYSVANANKGFFFTETEAIALGNSVSRRSAGQGHEIITTIDQTLWVGPVTYSVDGAAPATISTGADPDLSLTVNAPSWIHQGDIGYVIFPDAAQPLYIRGGSRVNLTDPSRYTGDDVIHFALGHGTDPASSGLSEYLYVIVPNVTAAEMPAYVNDLTNRVEIIANESGLQGIHDTSLDLVQLAFYNSGSAQVTPDLAVSADRPALVQLRRVYEEWEVCVTDPQHAYTATEINLQISENLVPGTYDYDLPGIYPMAGESMEVSASGNGVAVRVLLPDPSDDAAYNHQGGLYAGAPLYTAIPGAGNPLTVAEEDFQSGTWSGGFGWDGGWIVTSGSYAPALVLLDGNDSVKLTSGNLNHSITRTLASPIPGATLTFKWDVDSLDSLDEYAYAEVFDGTWHTVWSMNSSGKGSDGIPVPDELREASVDLSAYGAVTQIRFSMSDNTVGNDWFFVDDIELRMVVDIDYQNWTLDYGLSGGSAALLADPDGDGRCNLMEFGIGSVPTNGADLAAVLPYAGPFAGSTFEYTYRRRTDHVELGLDYRVERTTNLVDGVWTTSGITEIGTAPAEAGFESVFNEIPMGSEPSQFIRLNIETD